MMVGFAILLAFQMLGMLVNDWLDLQLPSNVVGLILFTISLFLGWVKLEWVESASEFLLKHMLLFFMPLVVGCVALYRYLGMEQLVASLVSLVTGTLLVLLVTGWITKLLIREKENHDAGSNPMG